MNTPNIPCSAVVRTYNPQTRKQDRRTIEALFHGFFQLVEDADAAYPVAVVEELPSGQIHEVLAQDVKMNRTPADA
jgi:hypothetical protein